MNRTEVYTKITEIIAQLLKIDQSKINEASTLESLGADSLDRFEFVMKLEEVFNIAINDDDAEKIVTVGQATDYVYTLVTAA
jgi:acyl carrier protein